MNWGTSIQAAAVTCSERIHAAVVMNAAHPAPFVTVAHEPEQVRRIFDFWFFTPSNVVGRHWDGRHFVLVLQGAL